MRRCCLFVAVATVAVLLSGCASSQAGILPAYTGWTSAIQRGDYVAARNLLEGSAATKWYTDTQTLDQQHGKIIEVGGGGGTRGGLAPYEATIRLTWQDGYQRCIRLDENVARELYIQGNGYLDCALVPNNPLTDSRATTTTLPARSIPAPTPAAP